MSNGGKIFVGILTAAAAGAVLGMLFAPDKGDAFRKKIQDYANDLTDEVLKTLQKSKEDMKSEFNRVKTKAKDEVANAEALVKNKLETLKTEGKNAHNNVKEQVG